ncbi:response regulator [uncultured Erythrobacter sp.]|uniref:response regulator transcription factor n=1 Tax=uncultured Erythrobacter sp. TaxID=263913 RepID=UPI00261CD559|nr:response regulator [uncultured Erythrobacter sp.]
MTIAFNAGPAVALVDDNRQIRTSICRGLTKHGMRCHPFACGEDFLEGLSYLSFDCVLLDLRMPDLDGMQTLRRIPSQKRYIPVIFFTSYADVSIAVDAMKSGARDFIEKPASIAEIAKTIEGFTVSSSVRSRNADMASGARSLVKTLSARENEVMMLVCEGFRSKQIANRLALSPRTIDAHRYSAIKKLGVNDLPNIVRMFQLAGAI